MKKPGAPGLSRQAIGAGGLPRSTGAACAVCARAPAAPLPQTSTAAEFLLLREAGFRPLAQVMGSCFYQVGLQYLPGKRAPGAFAAEGQATPGNAYASGFEYDSFGRRIYRERRVRAGVRARDRGRRLAGGKAACARTALGRGEARRRGRGCRRPPAPGELRLGPEPDRVRRDRHRGRLRAVRARRAAGALEPLRAGAREALHVRLLAGRDRGRRRRGLPDDRLGTRSNGEPALWPERGASGLHACENSTRTQDDDEPAPKARHVRSEPPGSSRLNLEGAGAARKIEHRGHEEPHADAT